LILTVLLIPGLAGAATLKYTTVVAITGNPAPDGTGEIFIPLRPVMQDGARPVFVSDIREGGFLQGSGIFRATETPGILELLVRSGQALPDANGVFHAINDPEIQVNNNDAIAFYNLIDDSLGGAVDNQAIFYTDGTQNGLKVVARTNQLDPTQTARYITMPNLITLNDSGQVSFRSTLDNALQGIFRGNTATDTVTVIAMQGDAVPVDTGTYSSFHSQHSMNESGQLAFHASVRIDNVNTDAIYLGDGTTTIEIVRKGDATPSANGTISLPSSGYRPVNDSGHVAFFSTLSGTSGGTTDNEALFIGNGTTTVEIARKGDFTPGDNGRYLNFDRRIEFNNSGQVLFISTITGATDGATEGVFLGAESGVVQIARINQQAPGGGRFSDFMRGISLNNAGDVLFFAQIDLENGGSTSDTHGLFLHNGRKLFSIARAGDTIPGTGGITQVFGSDDLLSTGAESSPLNDKGQVTYRFSSGGDIGIAVWLPPLFADSFESILNP
jgi:hypothetical protein